jgi:hypothetical protein
MACIINASTTSGLIQTADTSGVLQFQNNGVNLPMGGVAPAFSASMSGTQTLTNNTATKVTFNTELFDTNNNYDSTTNYRFTPTVAGYYQANVFIAGPTSATGVTATYIYKNGARYATSANVNYAGGNVVSLSSLVYLNGSTDYIECYCYQDTGVSNSVGSSDASITRFQACLVRGA